MTNPTLHITNGHPLRRMARAAWVFLIINAPILMGAAVGALATLGIVGIVFKTLYKGCN